MFRLSLVLALVAAFVVQNQCLLQTDLAVNYIHPHFPYAELLQDRETSGGEPQVILTDTKCRSVRRINGVLVMAETKTCRDLEIGAAKTAIFKADPGPQTQLVSYDDDRERLITFKEKANTSAPNPDFEVNCHYNVTTRAFEIIKGPKLPVNILTALLFDHNYRACLLYYDSDTLEAPFSSIRESYTLNSVELITTGYPIASMWADRWGANQFMIRLIDEAGFMYTRQLDEVTRKFIKTEEIVSLSSLNLEDDPAILKLDKPMNESAELVSSLKEFSADAIDNLKMHYKHAFVESIMLFRGSLCWSRGTGRFANQMLLSCIDPPGQSSPLPMGLTNVAQTKYSIRALEMYEFESYIYLHIVYVNLPNKSTPLLKASYYWCRASSLDDLREATFPREHTNRANETVCVNLNLTNMPRDLPLDLAFSSNGDCKLVQVFYQHRIRAFYPNLTLREAPSSEDLVNWMNFPLNAVLRTQNLYHLFIGGNFLQVVTPESNQCKLTSFTDSARYAQSQMLLRYEDDVKSSGNKRRSELLPIYSGTRFRRQSDDTWSERLNASDTLLASHTIPFVPSDPSVSTTPSPNGTSTVPPPKPPSEGKTSIIIIVVVVLIIIGIVCGSVYYFCFGDSEEPIRRPKSALRKLKTLGGSSGIQKLPAAGPAAAVSATSAGASAAASSITPVMTVRSGMHSPASAGANSKSTSQSGTKSILKPARSTSKKAGKTLDAAKTIPKFKSKSRPKSPGPPSSPRTATAKSAASVSPRKSSPGGQVSPKKSSPGPNVISTLSKRSPANSISSPSSPKSAKSVVKPEGGK